MNPYFQDEKNALASQMIAQGGFNTPKSPSPIESLIGQLGARIENLHEQLADMRRRLEPVSAPQVPSPCEQTGEAKIEPPKAPMEQQLRGLLAGVESANSQINNLLSYLHI